MILLGIDIGSSSVKAGLLDGNTGEELGSAFYPKQEMPIVASRQGFAEQHPQQWFVAMKEAIKAVLNKAGVSGDQVGAIGISYQMHGLVLVDEAMNVLRPSIIWCDSRAVEIGHKAFEDLGTNKCLSTLLNSPGNFTASKLKWVKDNEPDIFSSIHKAMLPGDYIAARLTGEICTTLSGLSEGIFWNFKEQSIATELLNNYGIDTSLLPDTVPTFGIQGKLTTSIASDLGLQSGTPVTYRAGDQPNNAFSLNVLEPGEVAATAGTSGVVYGVTDQVTYDPLNRVNTFAHVNYTKDQTRLGVLLCINGTGILNNWMRKISGNGISYDQMNQQARATPVGAEGLTVLPFGNGAERVLQNVNSGANFSGIDFNTHHIGHMFRAVQEGIAFSFKYGMDVMREMGMPISKIRAGHANMFLSPLFAEALSDVTGAEIELYNTDGALGAARGAGIGVGFYKSEAEAFAGIKKIKTYSPGQNEAYKDAYKRWESQLCTILD